MNLNKRLMTELMKSRNGLHLSIYLESNNNPAELKVQLEDLWRTAQNIVSPVLSEFDAKRLLAPVEKFFANVGSIAASKSNFALFRTLHAFHVIEIPTAINKICVISDSYHVKPLFDWLQSDPGYLILTIDDTAASLFSGSRLGVDFLEFYHFENKMKHSPSKPVDFSGMIEWFNNWIQKEKVLPTKRIFVSARQTLPESFVLLIDHPNVTKLEPRYSNNIKLLSEEAYRETEKFNRNKIDRTLNEFIFALKMEQTQNNIIDIARSAVKGEIAQLLIAKDVTIFGTVNHHTGKLSVNPFQLDHHDDDILDDLAQLVVRQGGQVTTIERDKIPGKRCAIAIKGPIRKTG